jgi:hypothetical protein
MATPRLAPHAKDAVLQAEGMVALFARNAHLKMAGLVALVTPQHLDGLAIRVKGKSMVTLKEPYKGTILIYLGTKD